MKGKRFKEYFTFTSRERNGIIVLLFLVVITVIFRIYQNNRSDEDIVLMTEDFQAEIDAFEKGLTVKQATPGKTSKRKPFKKKAEADHWFTPEVLFDFDPNKVSKKELKELGFSDKQSTTLINYRQSGGVFKEESDLLKIYGIYEEQYNILKPFIAIAENKDEKTKENIKTEKFVVEINTATVDDLTKLTGIGESYAQRIIKYRELLGGYYESKQLLEVYGLDSARFNGFSASISIDTSAIIKIDLNKANYKDLIRHPYLTKYHTEALLKYKEIMGNFSRIEQIPENNLLTKEEFVKVRTYLKVN